MRALFAFLLVIGSCGAQVTPLGGTFSGGGASSAPVTSGNTNEGQWCAGGGGESGGTACTLPAFTISHSGSAVYLRTGWCADSACSTTPPGGMSATDSCGNTYTPAVTHLQNLWSQVVLVAANVSAGTCTITLSQSGTGLWYTRWLVIECIGADRSSPVDPGVSNTANGSGTTVSVSSLGRTTAAGDLIIADFDVTNPSNTGTCTTLQTDNSSYIQVTASPGAGVSVTCGVTEASQNWWSTIIGIQP